MARSDSPPRYIVVDGTIGIGKTTLAKRIAESLQAELVLEQPELNPFLERFYRDPANGALPAQLFFLLERARSAQALRQSDMFKPVRVADFMLEKDRLFAELTLNDDELRLYEQIYAGLALDAPAPDLVIYLQAPVDVLLERIARRGIAYEQAIGRAYLARVELSQLAQASSAALYRRITPTGTSFDGDVIFAICPLDGPPAPALQAEGLVVAALERAVERAVRLATGRDGIPGLADSTAAR